MTDVNKDQEQHGRLRDGVDQAREAAVHALDTAKHRASDAAHATAETLESNPLGVLVGGRAADTFPPRRLALTHLELSIQRT